MQLTRCGAAQLTSLAVFSALALAGCNHTETPGTGSGITTPSGDQSRAVATLTTPKGATLTLSPPEFYAQLQNYVPNSPPSPSSPQGGYAAPGQSAGTLVMQQLLMKLMVEGLAQDQGLAPTDAEVNTEYNSFKMLQDARNIKGFEQELAEAGITPELFKEMQIKPQLAQRKILTKGLTVSDTEVQNFYNTNKDKQFTKPTRVHIKKIAVASLGQAKAIAAAIAGGQTFESQVNQSLDKSTPDGDVPQWVPIDPAPPGSGALIEPIRATPVGGVTPPIPVPGQNGQPTYWLIKVVEKKDKETLPLAQIKDLIQANLLQQKSQSPETLQQPLHDFQTQAKLSIVGSQYAALVQELTHPAPPQPSAPMGGSPFTPGPGPKP